MISLLNDLRPWQFSPAWLALTAGPLAAYLNGWRGCRKAGESVGAWPSAAFLAGVALVYAFVQTHLDYLSQHMFWVHRLQHVVLHHLAPFLIALSAPDEVLSRGTPQWIKAWVLRPLFANAASRAVYRVVQQPVIASVLFVGLIFLWLTPAVHFAAMLNGFLYNVMNGSMLIDGMLFWWLMIGPEHHGRAVTVGYGTRMAMLVAIALPQAVLGAYITFHRTVLFDVYAVCGRAWSISPLLDQQLGGLNTWIPPGMMSAAGMVVIASRWLDGEALSRRPVAHVRPFATRRARASRRITAPARCSCAMRPIRDDG